MSEVKKIEKQTRGLTLAQVQQLLKWVNENRVITANRHQHLAQQDVRAHLIRIFGFGNFDIDIRNLELVYESERVNDKGVLTGKWDVSYKALVHLAIRDKWGNEVCHYEDVGVAAGQNQARSEAHELAMKSAVSGAIKRCAINLGDQFGLSLYNNGQMSSIVKGTMIYPARDATTDDGAQEPDDVQERVERQTSLGLEEDRTSGNDESGATIGSGNSPRDELDRSASKIVYSELEVFNASNAIDEVAGFTSYASLQEWYDKIPGLHDVPVGKLTLKMMVRKKLEELPHGS